jgi:hypothetical protein
MTMQTTLGSYRAILFHGNIDRLASIGNSETLRYNSPFIYLSGFRAVNALQQ